MAAAAEASPEAHLLPSYLHFDDSSFRVIGGGARLVALSVERDLSRYRSVNYNVWVLNDITKAWTSIDLYFYIDVVVPLEFQRLRTEVEVPHMEEGHST